MAALTAYLRSLKPLPFAAPAAAADKGAKKK
jgi:hypothetical protein